MRHGQLIEEAAAETWIASASTQKDQKGSPGRRGDRSVRSQLSQLGRDAADHMERVLADMPKLNRGFNQVEATYTPEELKILRRQGPITQKMGDKLVQQVMLLAVNCSVPTQKW